MIKCFKCGSSVIQEPDGALRKTCGCVSPLVMTPEMPLQAITTGSTTPYQSPLSETPTIKPVASEERDPRDYPRTENLDTMSRHMEEHEQMCVSCSYLKQCGFRTRCVEYRNMQEIQAFWRKRVQA